VGTIKNQQNRFIPFIALEWLDGRSLDAVIETRRLQGKPPLPLETVVRMLEPVAQGLARAHNLPAQNGPISIVHRDLKPENLFIAKTHGETQVKILDFGIAKVKSAATQIVGRLSSEQSGLAAFTPAYGAPEQWLPKRFGQTGPWTDVWGLALTVVEAAIGRPPLEGDAHAILGAAIDDRERPTPRSLGVETSDEVQAIFERALAVDPKDRYGSVGLFWSDLQAAVLGGASERSDFELSQSVLTGLRRHASDSPIRVSSSAPTVRGAVAAPAENGSSSSIGSRTELELMDSVGGFRSDAPPHQSNPPLDNVGIMPSVVSSRPPSARIVARAVDTTPGPSLVSRFARPLKLMVVAVLIMGADFAYAAVSGSTFALGPVRASWIAGPMVLAALVLLVVALVRDVEG
jgi:serine/threonine-protein kinase